MLQAALESERGELHRLDDVIAKFRSAVSRTRLLLMCVFVCMRVCVYLHGCMCMFVFLFVTWHSTAGIERAGAMRSVTRVPQSSGLKPACGYLLQSSLPVLGVVHRVVLLPCCGVALLCCFLVVLLPCCGVALLSCCIVVVLPCWGVALLGCCLLRTVC